MPIYEYQCTTCQHLFDVMQKMSDPPMQHCPNCSKDTVIRLISAAGFQLKGTGWYATDFKDKGKPKPKPETETSNTESVATSKTKDDNN